MLQNAEISQKIPSCAIHGVVAFLLQMEAASVICLFIYLDDIASFLASRMNYTTTVLGAEETIYTLARFRDDTAFIT